MSSSRSIVVPAAWAAMLVASVATGCGTGPAPGDGRGETHQVVREALPDGATLVRTLSGSRWGATALAEEIASIGVLEGPPEYMLSRPVAVWLTTEEVYVLDSQEHEVRVYDGEGVFRRRFGGPGQGPGELSFPQTMTGSTDGRILVGDPKNGRVVIFSTEGALIDTWRLPPSMGRLWAVDDRVLTGRWWSDALSGTAPGKGEGSAVPALQAIGPSGFEGQPVELPGRAAVPMLTILAAGIEFPVPAPGYPSSLVFGVSPDGHLVAGYPDRYGFEIRAPDGRRTVVERDVAPEDVPDDEAAARLAALVEPYRAKMPDAEVVSGEMPTRRAAYAELAVYRDRQIWVRRAGAARRVENCESSPAAADVSGAPPCWEATMLVDLFDLDGSFLGSVRDASGAGVFPVDALGGRFASIEVGADGAPRVRVYVLSVPGDSE